MDAPITLSFDDLQAFAWRPRSSSKWVDVVIVDTDAAANRFPAFAACRPLGNRDVNERISSPLERQRRATARAALRLSVAAFLGLPADSVPLGRERRGRPVVSTDLSDAALHVSSSRSGRLAIFAVTPTGPVGVDIEIVSHRRFAPEVAKIMLSAGELKVWSTVAEDLRSIWLAWAWVRKEALLKAAGCGLLLDPTAIDTCGPAAQEEGEPTGAATGSLRAPGGWTLRHVEPTTNAVAAVAVRGEIAILTAVSLAAIPRTDHDASL